MNKVEKQALAYQNEHPGSSLAEAFIAGYGVKIGDEKLSKERQQELCQKHKIEFHDSLKEFLPLYGKDMVSSFFRYWSEANRSKTKMRFEMQKTWDIKLRLRTWYGREKNRGNYCSKQEANDYAIDQFQKDYEMAAKMGNSR